MHTGDSLVIAASDLDLLIGALRGRGYEVVGPTVRGGAIVLDTVEGVADLPAAWGDEQAPGRYRLRRRTDGALFGHAAPPQSWKRWLHPPTLVRLRATRTGRAFTVAPDGAPPRHAFLGVRACELAAIRLQDRVFTGGPFVDPAYRARREAAFVLAVHCGSPGGTCFCASVGTGPRASGGFDLAATEVLEDGRHDLVLEVGTERGAELAAAVPHRPAEPRDLEAAAAVVAAARSRMGRALETEGLRQLLYDHYEDPHWDEVGRRCLGCASCTMVCPTCFCSTIEDATDLAGATAERRRVWDSCFCREFSYVHGGSVRTSAGARYRQWITHKLATWQDQFGALGCVGCGRCATWCPAGIDITAEASALREADARGRRP